MQRAEHLLAGTALAACAVVPLAAQAVTIAPTDFVVEGSGAYFYNASGYFATWDGQPSGGTVTAVNPDGSAKLYGTASATPDQFLAHNCEPAQGCSGYQDRGIAMVYWGTLQTPAKLGDQVSMHYDLSIEMPDVGGTWTLSAALSTQSFGTSNSVGYPLVTDNQGLEAGTHHLSGSLQTEAVQNWQLDPESPLLHWQVIVAAVADAPWSESYYSDYYGTTITPYRGLTISVPDQSIDITVVNSTAPVPEPGTMVLALAGVGALLARRRLTRL
jgi:uncharacterized protein (TIGR03382 family)